LYDMLTQIPNLGVALTCTSPQLSGTEQMFSTPSCPLAPAVAWIQFTLLG
jgi:hypothetical protein